MNSDQLDWLRRIARDQAGDDEITYRVVLGNLCALFGGSLPQPERPVEVPAGPALAPRNPGLEDYRPR